MTALSLVAIAAAGVVPRRTPHLLARPPAARSGRPPCLANMGFDGVPSTPGWETGLLNELTDWAVADSPNRPIICEVRGHA